MIDEAFVIDHFPLYNKYFLDDDGDYATEVLEDEIAMSEAELTEYVDVDETTITAALKRHLLNIVKYRGFVRVHGDTEFASKPQIVKAYEATIAMLQKYKDGESTTGVSPDGAYEAGMISITAKTRRFNEWFNDPNGLTEEA